MSIRPSTSVWYRTAAALSAAALLTLVGVSSAHAKGTEPDSEQTEIKLVQLHDNDMWSPVSSPEPLNLDRPSSLATGNTNNGDVTPYLINLSQWIACFTFNISDEVFGEYYWIQAGRGVKLQCGNEQYGYKHIDKRHKPEWEQVYNKAVAAGWSASAYGTQSWDDLMHIVMANQIGIGGDYYEESAISQKACSYARFGLYNVQTNKLVYTFGTEIVWSMNLNRIITSYPSSRGTCNT